MAKRTLEPGEATLKNPKHEFFCVLYAGLASRKYFGNATQCYLHVYGGEAEMEEIDALIAETHEDGSPESENERRRLKLRKKSIYNTANTEGTNLLVKPGIRTRTNWLLDRYLEDATADREMAFVIGQREDLRSKVQAYQAVAKVKERIRGAGALTGEFSFSWEGDDESPAGKKPRVKVKASVSAPEEEEVAGFEE